MTSATTATERALECLNQLLPDLAKVTLSDLSSYGERAQKVATLFEIEQPNNTNKITVGEIRERAIGLCKSYFQLLDEAPSHSDSSVEALKEYLDRSRIVLERFEGLVTLTKEYQIDENPEIDLPSLKETPETDDPPIDLFLLEDSLEVGINTKHEPIKHANGVAIAPVTEAAAFSELFNITSTKLQDWNLPPSSVRNVHNQMIGEYAEIASKLIKNYPEMLRANVQQGLESLSIVTLLTLQVKWLNPGTNIDIHLRSKVSTDKPCKVPGVYMESGFDFCFSDAPSEILKELGKNSSRYLGGPRGDLVARVQIDNTHARDLPLSCCMVKIGDLGDVTQEQILQYVNRIRSDIRKINYNDYEIGTFRFPMVDLRFNTSLPPIIGTTGPSELYVDKAQFTAILKMNKEGALAQAKYEMLVLRCDDGHRKEEINYTIDDNFLCWFETTEKGGETGLLFAAYVTKESMKEPVNLDPELNDDPELS